MANRRFNLAPADRIVTAPCRRLPALHPYWPHFALDPWLSPALAP
ncbi:hypothetical protein [Streptomyces sp. NPDC050759]